MAAVTVTEASLNNDTVQVQITYDDTTLLIESATLVNNDAAGHLNVTVLSLDEQTTLFGPFSAAFDTGETVQDLSGLNQFMQSVVHQGPHGSGTDIELPWILQVSWSSS